MTQSGARDNPIEIWRNPEQADYEVSGRGPKLIYEAWASIRQAGSRETEIARSRQTVISHVVEIDFPHKQIGVNDFVKVGEDRKLNIVSINNLDEGDHTLRLMCMEVQR